MATGDPIAQKAGDSSWRGGANYPPSVKPCRLSSKALLKTELLLLELFALIIPLNIVTAAEGEDDDEEEDPETVKDDVEVELP